MQKRIGFLGIILHDRVAAERVNQLLSEYAALILARMGLPRLTAGVAVITLVVEATTDELGALAGKLGQLEGVIVQSALAKKNKGEVRT